MRGSWRVAMTTSLARDHRKSRDRMAARNRQPSSSTNGTRRVMPSMVVTADRGRQQAGTSLPPAFNRNSSVETPHERIRCVVHELGVVTQEGEFAGIGGAVALLANDDLGDALVGRFLVVVLVAVDEHDHVGRSEEHTSELQSLMRISYSVFGLKKKNKTK